MYDDRNYHIHDDFWNHRHIDATSSGGKKHLEVTYMVLLVEKSMNVWLTGFAVRKKIWTRPIAKNWIILHSPHTYNTDGSTDLVCSLGGWAPNSSSL
jgi:hypothetical protein